MTSWTNYYNATAGRAPRELFTKALALSGAADTPSRFAIDLGCGDGTETVALLTAGWNVLAIDGEETALELVRSRVPPELAGRLQTNVASFEEVTLPPADFIYAGLSLFFCPPSTFAALWSQVRSALRPGGMFAGHLLGERDTWAVNADITSQSAEQARQLLAGYDVEFFEEIENDRPAVSGPKHWHLFEVIARRS